MALTMLDAVDFTKIPSLAFVMPVVSVDPTGYEAGLIYNSTEKAIKFHNGTTWVALGPAGAGGPPTGTASGDLTGSYPGPTVAALAITDAKVAAANKDGLTAVPSMRTLGTGAQQAAAGNDSRFTDSRSPSGTAGGDLTGTYPNPGIAAGVIVDNDISGTAAIATSKISGLDAALTARALSATDFVAGAGMTGGGTLASTRTFDVIAGTGITVSANDVAVNTSTIQAKSEKGALNGYAGLDASGLIATANLPPLAINEVFTVASQAAMLALTAQRGDMAIRTDTGKTYVLSTDSPSTLADWKEVMATGQVVSVNGNTGVVSLTAANVGAPPTSRLVSTGNGLTGGGDLSADRTLSVVADTTGGATIAVGAGGVSVLSAPKWKSAMTLNVAGTAGFTGSASFDGSATSILNINGTVGARKTSTPCAAATTTTVNHAWNTRDVLVEVYRSTTPWDSVGVTVERTDLNNVLVRFASAPTAGQYTIVVTG